MARWAIAALLTVIPLYPALAQRLTVAKFRQTLAGYVAARKSDEAITEKCEKIELTERLTDSTLSAIENELKLGPNATLELNMLSDLSNSLDPPAAEIPAKDPPDQGIDKELLPQAMQFAATTMRQMPNFLATRVSNGFDNRPRVATSSGWTPAEAPFQFEGTTSEQIAYRNGEEVTDAEKAPAGKENAHSIPPTSLSTTGEFGPILSLVLNDSLEGGMAWSHWEGISDRLTAVYKFTVTEQASHYVVNFCWQLLTLDAIYRFRGNLSRLTTNCYHGKPGYHGSIAIDPESGAVMRIAIAADLPQSIALKRAEMSIRYGKVEIGGKVYVCPQSSVAVSQVHYSANSQNPSRDVLRVNETTFSDYRRFGSTVRILPQPAPH
jgi:hypothetical protein